MKLFNKLFLLMFTAMALIACDEEDNPTLNPSAETIISLSNSDVLLLKDNAEQDALTISWNEPNYGFDAAANYRINFIFGDKVNTVDAGTSLSKTFTVSELNGILLNTGLEGEVATDVTVRVDAVLSSYKEISSNNLTLTATAYLDDLDLSTDWGIVGTATPNGWDGPDIPFWTTKDPDVIVAYTDLTDGLIKFRPFNDWPGNLGDNGTDGSLEPDGANIPVTAGTYRILLNLAENTYKIEPYSWGLVGHATVNGWDGPDVKMEYNPKRDNWEVTTTLSVGEFKFRLNNDWPQGDFGDNDTDGTIEPGGANIPVETAGEATVTVDFNKLTYSVRYI